MKHLKHSIALIVIVFALAARASAADVASSGIIIQCQPWVHSSAERYVDVEFRNLTPYTLSSIDYVVDWGDGTSTTFSEHGSFASGVDMKYRHVVGTMPTRYVTLSPGAGCTIQHAASTP